MTIRYVGAAFELCANYVVEEDVNSLVNEMWRALDALSAMLVKLPTPTGSVMPSTSKLPGTPPLNTAEFVESLKRISELIKEFNEVFEIKPSQSILELEVYEGRAEVEIALPKVVKRGTNTPRETLKALKDYVAKMYEELIALGAEVTPSALMEKEVVVKSEPGVKVKLAGEEVSTVKFKDIGELEVEIKAEELSLNTTAALAVILVAVVLGTAFCLLKRKKFRLESG